ncbi:MAG TPA: SRPBCC domain-containing protein [Planctomycetota bacterium]|jgi:uncharacterized protein YndB with AHSA1/START domain|nr:SRPBCC domain-containing protein [Planctomycetota bacterium]
MKHPSIAALLLGLSLPRGGSEDPPVQDSSFVAPDGSRVLQQSIVVKASRKEVWDALTTAEGVKSWAVPVAAVDFRLGGIWESTYDPNGKIGDPRNIQNRYLSYLPMRMISIQPVQAPPGFPHPELLPNLFFVLELEDLALDRIRVTLSGVGYRSGEGYDAIYRHFEKGNAWSLAKLHRRFAEGPIDWGQTLGGRGR